MQDHAIITGSNSLISIFAGFVVYAVLGNVVHEHSVSCPGFDTEESRVDAVNAVYNSASISLAFVVYPRVSQQSRRSSCRLSFPRRNSFEAF